MAKYVELFNYPFNEFMVIKIVFILFEKKIKIKSYSWN